MRRAFALARLAFLNGMRKHAVWGLVLFSLFLEGAGVLAVDFFGHDLGRVASDYLFSVMWLTGMLLILFHAVASVAWDENHKAIDSILARPISRGEYVLGQFAGLAALLLLLETLLGGGAFALLAWIHAHVDQLYFPVFSKSHFLLAWLGLMLILLATLAVVLLLSAMVRGAFPVMLLTLAWQMTCAGVPVVRESLQQAGEQGGAVFTLLNALGAVFPDWSRLDFKNAVVASSLADAGATSASSPWVALFAAAAYAGVALALAAAIYRRRDIL